MAFTDFTPKARVTLSQDGKSFRIYDNSLWNGESGRTISAVISIMHIDDNDTEIKYHDYLLIRPGDHTMFLRYLSEDGLQVNISELSINGTAAPDRFPDGYYEISVIFDDGSYDQDKPYCTVVSAFLAKYRSMKRTMPALLLAWPITDEIRRKNDDIYSLGLYLDAAEYAASLEELVKFRKFVSVIRNILDHYEIPEPW